MTTRTITSTQLRGMIKEALEESIVEISLDEQIATLKAKGNRRTLEETKRYRTLLEMKVEMAQEGSVDEGMFSNLARRIKSGLGMEAEEGEEGEEIGTGVDLRGKAKYLADKFEEGTPLGDAVKQAEGMSPAQRVELAIQFLERLGLTDTSGEVNKVLVAVKDALRAHQSQKMDESRRVRRR